MGHGVYEQLSRKNPEREKELGILIRRGTGRAQTSRGRDPWSVCLQGCLKGGLTYPYLSPQLLVWLPKRPKEHQGRQ